MSARRRARAGIAAAAFAAASLATVAAPAPAAELSGYVAAEVRLFPHAPLFAGQRDQDLSLAAEPEWYQGWNDGRDSVLFVPFARLDSADSERTHADVRDLLWTHAGDGFTLRAGVGRVFWGVTESQHLIDIVNQTDLVEDVDGEEKLGQPMLDLTLIGGWGDLDLFVLPWFRERTFPGRHGRLRTDPPVDTGSPVYESSRERRHVDLAVRWSQAAGPFDIGISHFHGTAREPLLVPVPGPGGALSIVPRYDVIDQTGLDLQATLGEWLWKLEVLRRAGQGPAYVAATGGFEYTFVGFAGGRADVGVLAEYLYDERADTAAIPFEADVFLGVRVAANDAAGTAVLAGVIQDVGGDGTVFSLEASRRIDDRWTISLEARGWTGIPPGNALYPLREDDYIQFTFSRYF